MAAELTTDDLRALIDSAHALLVKAALDEGDIDVTLMLLDDPDKP